MNWKKRLITYAALSAVAVVAVLIALSLGTDPGTAGSAARLMNASNGCFAVAVLYIGCSVLVFIQEAGNFYGIQFLFHTMAQRFSLRKTAARKEKPITSTARRRRSARRRRESRRSSRPCSWWGWSACSCPPSLRHCSTG